MRKFTCLLTGLLAFVWTMASAQDYSVWYDGVYTRNDRKLNGVTLTSPTYGVQTATAGSNTYTDLTSSTTFQAEAGETLSIAFAGYATGWMNGYLYIDTGNDGFTAGVDATTHAPTGDLMTYSFYSGNDNSDTSGYNSEGTYLTGGSRSTLSCPSFICPTTPGTYRMRFKVDWNSIDPKGDSNDTNGNFKGNGGAILDVMLEVKAVPANRYDVTYVYKQDGTELYRTTNTYGEGVDFPAYDNIPAYMDVTVSPERPATVTADGTYEVNTTLNADSPFKFSSSLSDAKWVTMKLLFSKEGTEGQRPYDEGTWILGKKDGTTAVISDNATADNCKDYIWAFVGDWHNGYKVYSYADPTQKLAFTQSYADPDANRTVTLSSDAADNLCTWELVNWAGTDAVGYTDPTYVLRLVNTNYHTGHHLSNGSLGVWNSTTGHIVNHGRIAFADPLAVYLPYATAVAADAGKVGYPQETADETTALNAALTTATTFKGLETYVQAYQNAYAVVYPVDGKAYKIKARLDGSDKYFALGTDALAFNDTEGAVFVCHELPSGNYAFVNNNGTFFTNTAALQPVGSYSTAMEFSLSRSGADSSLAYGTFSFTSSQNYSTLKFNGSTFESTFSEAIEATATTAFHLEEVAYANTPAMTVANGIDPSKKVATFSAPFAFTLPAGIDAYTVETAPAAEEAVLTKLASAGEVVAANTGVVLLGETDEASLLMIPATKEGVTSATNWLGHSAGAAKNIVTDATGTNYILALVGGDVVFSKALANDTNENIAMNKAYLHIPAGAAVNQFKLTLGGETTGISTLPATDDANAPMYDLQGRRIATPAQHGIYIKNGKKYMVK